MRKFCELPKTIQKTVRYIYQDASYEQVLQIKRLFDSVIQEKLSELEKGRKEGET